ncbi:MAG: ABC transporter ATP-binding protein [Acidimicrobiales bacterium]
MTIDAFDPTDPVAPVVKVTGLNKEFRRGDTPVKAIDDVSFEVAPGQMVVLVGPSGCGKTTLLRSIAGLERPDTGRIELHGRPVFASDDGIEVPTEQRRVAMVFQNYALWPHLSAFDNVVYPLRANRTHRVAKAEAAERVHDVLALVGIPDLADQYPSEMSGGQRQRVALARALVAGTDLVLFDEPLSNVDAKVRTHLRLELLEMQQKLGFSALFVTHDQTEAMELADRIAVMGHGRVQQFGTPVEVYQTPTSRYVADFIGSMNELVGTVTTIDEVVEVDTPLGPVRGLPGADVAVGDRVSAIWRPERTLLSDDQVAAEQQGANVWRGKVDAALFLGSHTEHVVHAHDHRFLVWSPDVLRHDADGEVWLSVQPRHVRILPADLPQGGEDPH